MPGENEKEETANDDDGEGDEKVEDDADLMIDSFQHLHLVEQNHESLKMMDHSL